MTSPLGDFLRARRARVSPEDVGLPVEPGRKVKGLRREEVARLAAISPEYYLRLEQGRHRQPSAQVVESLAKALLLDRNGTSYLHRLVRLQSVPSITGAVDPAVTASVRATLNLWVDTPAVVYTSNGDIVIANESARGAGGLGLDVGVNLVVAVFSAQFRASALDWEMFARYSVANLRWRSDPTDPHLQEIVGLLSLRDADFRRIWALNEVYPEDVGTLRFFGPPGETCVHFQSFNIPATPGWMMLVMRAERAAPLAAADVSSEMSAAL